mgnify:CR=1 FL=1
MKAKSIHAEYATDITTGKTTEEYRSWPTSYRGDILICSQPKSEKPTPTLKTAIYLAML